MSTGWKKEKVTGLLSEAGAIAMHHRRHLRQELKADNSIVTQADREIEDLLTRELEAPERGARVIGEETVAGKSDDYLRDAVTAEGRETWVIDPIDGTSPYAHGLPNWGISIGYLEGGRLCEGAVYLPMFGEIVMTDGDAVLEGVREGGSWSWRELPPPDRGDPSSRLVAITQAIAKRGRVDLPNPVLVLGAAVVPLVGLAQGRFHAYLGSVRLWDAAGALAPLLRHRFVASVRRPEGAVHFDGRVDARCLDLDPGSPRRWRFHSDLLVCRPEDETRLREAFVDDPGRLPPRPGGE